jgi:hypothetical protein
MHQFWAFFLTNSPGHPNLIVETILQTYEVKWHRFKKNSYIYMHRQFVAFICEPEPFYNFEPSFKTLFIVKSATGLKPLVASFRALDVQALKRVVVGVNETMQTFFQGVKFISAVGNP